MDLDLSQNTNPKTFSVFIKRVLWVVTWNCLFNWLPKHFSSFKVLVINLFGGEVAKGILIMPFVRIDMPWNLKIGKYSAIGKNVWLYNFGVITIGSNTVISQNTTICTATHDFEHPFMPLIIKNISIGNQVWIASDCFVLPGVDIAEGSVIGARSLVTKNIPSWGVYAGNPLRFIKKRIIKNNI